MVTQTVNMAFRASLTSRASQMWRSLRTSPSAILGLTLVGIEVVVACIAPLIAPYSPTAEDGSAALEGPSLHHLFGADQFGRDLLSRLLTGASGGDVDCHNGRVLLVTLALIEPCHPIVRQMEFVLLLKIDRSSNHRRHRHDDE